MAKITTSATNELVLVETSLGGDVMDGALGLTKFMASSKGTYYNGNVVATAQAVGIAAGMYVAVKFPKANPFKKD